MYILNSLLLLISFTLILFLKFYIVFLHIALFFNLYNAFPSLSLFFSASILLCVLNLIYGFIGCVCYLCTYNMFKQQSLSFQLISKTLHTITFSSFPTTYYALLVSIALVLHILRQEIIEGNTILKKTLLQELF